MKGELWKWGSFWFWWCSWSNKKIHANKVTGCFLLQIIKHPTLGVWGGLLQHLFSLAKQNNLKGRQGENGNKNRSFISDKNWKLIIYILRQMGISILNLSIWCPWPHSQEMLGDFRSPHPAWALPVHGAGPLCKVSSQEHRKGWEFLGFLSKSTHQIKIFLLSGW